MRKPMVLRTVGPLIAVIALAGCGDQPDKVRETAQAPQKAAAPDPSKDGPIESVDNTDGDDGVEIHDAGDANSNDRSDDNDVQNDTPNDSEAEQPDHVDDAAGDQQAGDENTDTREPVGD